MMRQVLEEEYQQAERENRPHQFVGMIISSDRRNIYQRRYNSPTTHEIAAIFKSSNGQPPAERDVRGHLLIPSRGRRFIGIDTQKPMCDPMTYPLLFPNGDDGWDATMPTHNNRAEREHLTVGQVIVLPSSFIGSPRAMKQAYQDAMTICGKFGKSTFFLTFTCNPKWKEITASISTYQTASDRPDVVARVFNQKKKELINDVEKRQVLGFSTARIHVVEFQKRGLPHCHMLLWIDGRDAPLFEGDVDGTICAEIPNKSTHPRLFDIVMVHMVHEPCGSINKKSPCMDGDKCVKSFPKPLSERTIVNDNGYPTYRRRDTGVVHRLKRRQTYFEVDNRWIVPYNPWLSLKFRLSHQFRILRLNRQRIVHL